MAKAVGAAAVGTDRLKWATGCGVAGVDIYAWFEYGLIAAYGSLSTPFATFADGSDWILGKDGSFYWMDIESGALDFLAQLMVEVANDYPGVRGLQVNRALTHARALPPSLPPSLTHSLTLTHSFTPAATAGRPLRATVHHQPHQHVRRHCARCGAVQVGARACPRRRAAVAVPCRDGLRA